MWICLSIAWLDLNTQMNTVKRSFANSIKIHKFSYFIARAFVCVRILHGHSLCDCWACAKNSLCLLMSAVCEFEQIIKNANLPACEWKWEGEIAQRCIIIIEIHRANGWWWKQKRNMYWFRRVLDWSQFLWKMWTFRSHSVRAYVHLCKSSTIFRNLFLPSRTILRIKRCQFLVSKHGHSAASPVLFWVREKRAASALFYILAYLSSDAGNHFILNTVYLHTLALATHKTTAMTNNDRDNCINTWGNNNVAQWNCTSSQRCFRFHPICWHP